MSHYFEDEEANMSDSDITSEAMFRGADPDASVARRFASPELLDQKAGERIQRLQRGSTTELDTPEE